MMSTALVMAVEGEQTKIRSATSDRVESGGMTFAQSFGERVGLSVDVQTMNSAGDASSEMRGGKGSGLLKNNDAFPVALAGAKVDAVVDQRMTEANETKSVAWTVANATGMSVAGETDLVVGANALDSRQSKATPMQLPADRGELQQDIGVKVAAQAGVSQTKTDATAATGNEELLAGEVEGVETSAVVSNDVLAAESTTVDAVLRGNTATADRSLLPRDEVQPIVQSATVLAGKTLDVTSAKKSAKTQESEVGAKAASKPAGMTESAKTVGDTSVGAGVQGANPLPIQAPAPSDGQPNVVGVTVANVATAGKDAVGASTTGTDSTTGRKAMVRAGKDEVETRGLGMNTVEGATAATGFGAEIDKALAVASTGKDADEKVLGAGGATALVHVVLGNEAVASGIVTGMTSGHTPVEISGTKVQAGEAGDHTATAQAGLVDQDGSGAAAAEMDMSHRTLLATPMALEVGVANGTQGWLKIRAEMTDGGVSASLSSPTSAGQEMLHRELPALTAYLQEERVAVNTVVVPASAAAGTDSRFAGGMDGDGSGQAQQSSGQRGGDDRQGFIQGTFDRADEIPAYVGLNGVGEDGLYPAGMYAGGGSWLNVRA